MALQPTLPGVSAGGRPAAGPFIGLGVGIDDPNGATLAYLRAIKDELNQIRALTGQLGSVLGGRATGRGPQQQALPFQQQAQQAKQAAQAVNQAQAQITNSVLFGNRRQQAANNTTFQQFLQQQRTMAQAANQGPRGTAGRPGFFGIGAGGGFGTILSSILTRDLIRGAIRDVRELIKVSLEAAQAEANATLELKLASAQSGLLLEENLKVAERLRANSTLSRAQAEQTTAEVQRFATGAGRTGQAGDLAAALADIAAGRGVAAKQLPQFIEEAQNEQGKFAERYLGKSIETIYRDYTRANRAALSQGRADQDQSLSALSAGLTDFEKKQALANEVLKQAAQYHGAAATKAATQAGSLDSTKARFDDLAASFGRFIEQNHVLVNLLTTAKGIVDSLGTGGGPQIGSGPAGTFTQGDLQKQLQAARQGPVGGISGGIERLATIGFGLSPLGIAFTARNPEGLLDTITGRRRQREIEEGIQNEYQARHNEQLQELSRSGRLLPTGPGPINFAQPSSYRILDEQQFAAEQDRRLAQQNQQRNLINSLETIRGRGAGQLAGTPQLQEFLARTDKLDEELNAPLEKQQRNFGLIADDVKGLQGDLDVLIAKHKETEELVRRQVTATEKLREAQKGLYKVIEEVATANEPQNPFVKLLSDGATAAERMRQQWGYLGQETTDYFTQLELRRVDVALLKQQFDSLAKSQQLFGQAEQEQLERLGPDLSKFASAIERAAQVGIKGVGELAGLERKQAAVRGFGPAYLSDERFYTNQISDILSIVNALSLREGIGAQGRRAIGRTGNEAIAGIIDRLPINLVRNNPFLRATALQTFAAQQDEVKQQFQDELTRAGFVAAEDARVAADIRKAQNLAGEARRSGRPGADRIGEEFDRYLIARTQGQRPQDLAPDIFQLRNEALRREAARAEQDQAEAKRAVEEGLAAQKNISNRVDQIADAITHGDLSLLVQVENKTNAEIDSRNLRDTGQLEGLRPQEAQSATSGLQRTRR